jgi:hypothetical protein
VRVLVDGAVSYDAASPGSVRMEPGPHVVEVVADYRLRDPFFTYVRGYHVELRSTRITPASEAPVVFAATAVPSGGVTAPVTERAALTWTSFPGR